MQTNYDISVHLDLNGGLQTGEKNPFYIPEITDHMFQFLKLSDLKNCRLVCLKWNQLAEKFIQKLAVVDISEPERVEEFNQAFPNPQQSRIFTCFRFGAGCLDFQRFEWHVHKFVSLCEKWHNNLSELTLFRADLLQNQNETYDLSPFLPLTLIKLRIQSFNPLMMISIDRICNMRIFQLEGCILNITPGTTLNNVELELASVTFRDGLEDIEEVLINPFLNFDVLKKASFSGENIKLDLQGSHSLDKLTLLNGVRVLNWETSTWEIKKISFCLDDQLDEFEEVDEDLTKTQIKYKELEMNLKNFNVSSLPEGIEKLKVYLDHDGEVPPRIYGEHNFPNLKELHIETKNDVSTFVEFFKHCPKLSVLTVTSFLPSYDSNGKSDLKTSTVPSSVKTLRVISGVRIIVDRSFQLESLIFHNPPFPFPSRGGKYDVVVELTKELSVNNLYWFTGDLERNCYQNMFENEKINTVKSLMDLNLEKFVVGKFSQVNNSKFEKSSLFPLVETQAEYYLFQRGQKGKAISGRDAKKMSKL